MFLRAIFINGTLPVLSIYYEEKFSDRKISSMIGSIQTSMSFVACKTDNHISKNKTSFEKLKLAPFVKFIIQLGFLEQKIKSNKYHIAHKFNLPN